MGCNSPGFLVHHQLLELAQIHVHWIGDAIQTSHLLLSTSPPAFTLSQHQDFFQWISSSHQVAKVLGFQLQHQSFPWIFRFPFRLTGLISLQSKGLSSLLQHHSSKASILRRSAFFLVQLLHPYMTTGKTIALTRRTLVTKVMSLLLNVLSGLVIREGNGTPLQYSCLENPMDGGAWWAAVHGVAKSQTQLRDFTFTFHFHELE